MRRTLLFLLSLFLTGALLLVLACEKSEVTELDAGLAPDTVVGDVAPEVTPTDDVTDDGGVADTGGGERVVGDPCTEDGTCPTEWCATTEAVTALLRRDYEVPGGLCTVLFCAADAVCGAQAVCRDGGGFGLCAQTCGHYADCRYAQGWACAGPDGEVAEPVSACLPQGGLAAARCGDGVCDESERYVADQCPADCPDPPQKPYTTGGPCAAPTDCATNFCLNEAFLAVALPDADVDVPNGYCASNPLANPCDADEDCGEGGICADATALAGTQLFLCLHSCVDDSDCRYGEGYRCFATGEGEGAQQGCLPASVIAAIRCGDGVCDPSEAADPELCPPDPEAGFEGDCP